MSTAGALRKEPRPFTNEKRWPASEPRSLSRRCGGNPIEEEGNACSCSRDDVDSFLHLGALIRPTAWNRSGPQPAAERPRATRAQSTAIGTGARARAEAGRRCSGWPRLEGARAR